MPVLPARLDRLQLPHHLVEVPRGAAGGHVEADLGVEGGQAHRVLLPRHQVGEDRRQVRAVLELGELAVVAVAHRAAGVQQDLDPHVGLFLVLLDVEALGAGEHLVVEVAGVVAGGVLAVLGELDAEALVRAGVQAADRALDHAAGHEREVLHPGQGRRARDSGIRFGGVIATETSAARTTRCSPAPTKSAQNSPGGR